jgi:hypothetical protein
MKIGIITLCIGELYETRWKSSVFTKKIYCEQHGYDFIYINKSLDKERKPHWSKIKAIQQNLKKYDWIFYSDADAHFMNLDFKLEDVINKYSEDHFMIITKDNNMLNSGNFFIKNNSISKQFLIDSYNEFPSKPLPMITHKGEKVTMLLNDQYGIYINSIKDLYKNKIKFIPQRIINAYPCACCGEKYQAGDFLIHFVNHRRPTHNWGGDSDEPYKEIVLAEAKTKLYQNENLINKLKKHIQILNFKYKQLYDHLKKLKN